LVAESIRCAQCAAPLGAHDLACASCGALVHAVTLKQLATDAEAKQAAGDPSGALAGWRQALDLLPPGTRQHQIVAEKVDALSRAVTAAPPKRSWTGAAGAAGAAALGLASKGKLLLAGLGKATTVWSMLLSFSVYWTMWGWKFALGLVATIYVHEMGHVVALRRYGLAATAPMFIPGFGALVRLKQYPVNADEDAAVGIAGPRWGAVVSYVCWAVALATGWKSWLAIAHTSAFINLFNLLPIASLDGGRSFRALSRSDRAAVAVVCAAVWWSIGGGALALLLGALTVVAVLAAFSPTAPVKGSKRVLIEYAALVAALTFLAHRVAP
jgi:Zn-dependent protease